MAEMEKTQYKFPDEEDQGKPLDQIEEEEKQAD